MFILEDCDHFLKVAAVIFQMSESRGQNVRVICYNVQLKGCFFFLLLSCDAKITVVRRHEKEMSELSKGKTTRLNLQASPSSCCWNCWRESPHHFIAKPVSVMWKV